MYLCKVNSVVINVAYSLVYDCRVLGKTQQWQETRKSGLIYWVDTLTSKRERVLFLLIQVLLRNTIWAYPITATTLLSKYSHLNSTLLQGAQSREPQIILWGYWAERWLTPNRRVPKTEKGRSNCDTYQGRKMGGEESRASKCQTSSHPLPKQVNQ